MANRKPVYYAIVICLLCFVPFGVFRFRWRSGTCQLPALMVWAWERPEDLRGLPKDKIGVAFLCQTIWIRNSCIEVYPRRQPLYVDHGTIMLAVTRIEVDRHVPLCAMEQTQKLAQIIVDHMPDNAAGVQIDFDAVRSERALYTALIRDTRRLLPTSKWLSITALASWALYDDWISQLPVDEAVPMCFQMGPDRDFVRQWLATKRPFMAANARAAIGMSLAEPLAQHAAVPRQYIFNPAGWDKKTLAIIQHTGG